VIHKNKLLNTIEEYVPAADPQTKIHALSLFGLLENLIDPNTDERRQKELISDIRCIIGDKVK
jgi:hypothetical protein